ncbi:hypothetical protein ONZ45_g9726 [Pleurotus djamor]|nr:hypothetical protein ONZ45_g13176 [Pleurotus djamor]KAJ8507961.1 hypothetical protein ONZ45_g9726 [Pleurotus djamor]
MVHENTARLQTELPLDVVLQIVELLEEISTLRNLILVSKSFKDVAKPFLYRNVVFDDQHDPIRRTRANARLSQFFKQIKNDDRLAHSVKSLCVSIPPQNLRDMFPYLTNLRRLSITSSSPPPDPIGFYKSLEYFGRLNHLTMCQPIGDIDSLVTFLNTQTPLEHLCITSYDLVALKELPLSPESLPNLRSLVTYDHIAYPILVGRNIRHVLVLASPQPPPVSWTKETFDTVETLACGVVALPSLPSFSRMKLLELHGPKDANLGKILSSFRQVNWPNLEYASFKFQQGALLRTTEIAGTLKRFPALNTIDVAINEWSDDPFLQATRYRLLDSDGARSLSKPQNITRRFHQYWDEDLWWYGRFN